MIRLLVDLGAAAMAQVWQVQSQNAPAGYPAWWYCTKQAIEWTVHSAATQVAESLLADLRYPFWSFKYALTGSRHEQAIKCRFVQGQLLPICMQPTFVGACRRDAAAASPDDVLAPRRTVEPTAVIFCFASELRQ